MGDEQFCFVEGCQRSWDELPAPDGPLTVGIDGGYVRGRHKQGHFEVIAGKSILAFERDQEGKQQLSGRCFAWVQTYDEKPKRRLFELLKSQGMQPNQQVDFLSDGGEDVRNVQLYLNPQAEHLLDWFHLTMRLTVLNQTAKGLPESVGEGEDQYELRTGVIKDLERIKWYLWHGNVFQALNELQSLEMDLDAAAFESKNENSQKLLKGVEELHTYVERNQEFVPNYGERYRNGERIASGFVESAINQVVSKRMVKKQQMGWSQRGAHLILQIQTPRARRRVGEHLPALVSRFPPSSASQESGLTPQNLPLSGQDASGAAGLDETVRVIASIHDRIVSASLILHRLGSYARQNSVHQALAEIGRVHKTIHILRTLDDEEYRRRMGRELNKGEASHDLSRFLCFGKEGALRGREFGDQIHTFSCLSVLHNAVVAWNTLHIGPIVGQLRAEGQVIDDDILGLTTPLFRKHLNPFGKYHFDLERMRQTEGDPEQGIA